MSNISANGWFMSLRIQGLIAVFLIFSNLVEAAPAFSISKYLKDCGGKIYSKCDSADLNQETIFEAGRSHALENKLGILIVFGADWCPACRKLSQMLSKDPETEKLHAKYAVIEINGDLKSAKELAKKLNLSYIGYPQAFVLSAETREMRQQIFPTSFKSVGEILAAIDPAAKIAPRTKPTRVGSTNTASLEKSIELTNDYGGSTFYSNPKNDAERFVNQGVAALQVYHYLDAYRSFKAAERRDKNLVMPYVGQIIAVMQMDFTDGEYFAHEAELQLLEIAKGRPLSPAEAAWSSFGESFKMAFSENFVKPPGRVIKTLRDSFEGLVSVDSANLDGIALAAWLSGTALEHRELKEIFRKILEQSPNNIGAHHSLLHIAESENDPKAAEAHAVKLASLVPNSAHAQHMYGHTLPQKGRWAEALVQFKKADALHHAWAKRNGLELNQDWHYSHNLDLMAAVHLGMGNLEGARQTWAEASYDGRANYHTLILAVVTKTPAEAKEIFKPYEAWGDFLKPLRNEIDLTKNSARTLLSEMEKQEVKRGYDEILVKVLKRFASRDEKSNSQLVTDVQNYLSSSFKQGGFDGWSNAYLELLRIKRIAKILSLNAYEAFGLTV